MASLQIDLLAIFETNVILVSEGGIAGEIPRNIMVGIEGNIVPLALADVSVSVSVCSCFQPCGIVFLHANVGANRVFENNCKHCKLASKRLQSVSVVGTTANSCQHQN